MQEPTPPRIDTENSIRSYSYAVKKDTGNLPLGILGGIAAALLGAMIWALITYWTKYQTGFMAIGVGLLVGLAVRTLGKGTGIKFGIIGAVLALFGCLAGNVLAACIWASQEWDVPIWDVLSILDMQIVIDILSDTFSPVDILFYALAIYEGFRFSIAKADGSEKVTI